MKKINITYMGVTAILTAVAVILFITGFLTPPMGEIDGSVLTAGGILFAFSALWASIFAIVRGADVTIRHGQTDLTINNEKE